ncbi:MAG TPA: hypothetical protein DCG57_06280 [Candidatus Riflebacteria bacterium]|nr:hypothetical protein [Candidatus Riflebacteria bacterium]
MSAEFSKPSIQFGNWLEYMQNCKTHYLHLLTSLHRSIPPLTALPCDCKFLPSENWQKYQANELE